MSIAIDKLENDLQSLRESEDKMAEVRSALYAPLDNILQAAGLGSFSPREKIESTWETADGGLHICTEDWSGGYNTYSYTIPGEILKAEDPLAAAVAYKRRKASEADEQRRARTLAEIERLKKTL